MCLFLYIRKHSREFLQPQFLLLDLSCTKYGKRLLRKHLHKLRHVNHLTNRYSSATRTSSIRNHKKTIATATVKTFVEIHFVPGPFPVFWMFYLPCKNIYLRRRNRVFTVNSPQRVSLSCLNRPSRIFSVEAKDKKKMFCHQVSQLSTIYQPLPPTPVPFRVPHSGQT